MTRASARIEDALTIERILTHPKAFGLSTPTSTQRAICRAVDGLPLGELAACEEVQEAFGDVDALPVGERPREVHVLAGIRTAKSLIAAASILRASQIVDVSKLGHGDIVRISVVSLKLDNTRAIMGHLLGNVLAKPLLRPLLVGKPEDASETYLQLRHPSGRPIEVVPVPLDRAGGSITSFWSAGIVIDEEPRMIGAEDGTRNWDHVRDAGMGRLLEGAQLMGIGSPHAPWGPIYDLVNERWGKPSGDMIIVRAKAPAMNPQWWTPKRCADLRRQNPTAYRTDVLCEFCEPETSLLTGAELDLVTRAGPMVLPANGRAEHIAAMDPGVRSNSWTLIVLESGAPHRVALARQWTGSRSSPLSPALVLRDIREALAGYGVEEVWTDQYAVDAIRDLARAENLDVRERTTTAASKFTMLEGLKTLVASKGVELSSDPVLRRDLLSLKKRITQAGVQIVAGRSSDGRHADYASSLALALLIAQERERSSYGDGLEVISFASSRQDPGRRMRFSNGKVFLND